VVVVRHSNNSRFSRLSLSFRLAAAFFVRETRLFFIA
jgi:hypothetical protein